MPDRLILIFMIDALGFTQAGDRAYLPDLDGPRAPVRSVLGYSSAAIPTILSGQLPQSHGHFSMYRRSGSRGGVFRGLQPWLNLACRAVGPRWRFRQWIARYLERRGITGYFSLYQIPLPWLGYFDLCQRRDLYAPGAFDDGVNGLADHLERMGSYRVWNWRVPEERAFAELEAEIERGQSRALFLYTASLDSTMHAAGPGSAAAGVRLRAYEERITALARKARSRYDEVRLFVFGDHGMARVDAVHDLWGPLRKLALSVPKDLIYFLDSTMARFWFQSDRARRQVDELLSGLSYGRVLSDDELSELGAYFPEKEYGERIFLLHEGSILTPSFMSDQPVAGMHGYHPDAEQSFTTLLTNAHDVAYPQNLLELHTVLRDEILGVTA